MDKLLPETSSFINEVFELKQFREQKRILESNYNNVIKLLKKITTIPSPTFFEDKKADFVAETIRQFGLKDVSIDSQKNVIAAYPGASSNFFLPIFAHIDTVFPIEMPLKVTESNEALKCPGIGDNSSSVTAIISIIELWKKTNFVPDFDVIFIANSCEEGLGDLKGIKYFLDNYPKIDTVNKNPPVVLVIDGVMENIIHVGVGSKRIKVKLFGPGGHSWSDFGVVSAIHTLGRCISKISELKVPSEPRTTYNVGLVSGGTSVNTIASDAECIIDMRSISESALNILENKILDIFESFINKDELSYTIEGVGYRPTGNIAENHFLVELAKESQAKFKITSFLKASSTDANIPLSRGIPAVTIGVHQGTGAHTIKEQLNPKSLMNGIAYANLLIQGILKYLKVNLQ